MKKVFYFMIMLLAFTACHTTEENYKAAYDKAVQRTQENEGGKYITEQTKRMQATDIVNGDSVRIVRSYANIIDGNNADTKKFGVAVAEFDQVINARSYRDRLKTKEGFESYVLYTNKDKKYVVIVQGYDTKGAAAAFIKNIKQYMKMKILVPRPYILQRL